jgi:hypothetical protein
MMKEVEEKSATDQTEIKHESGRRAIDLGESKILNHGRHGTHGKGNTEGEHLAPTV